MKIHSLHIENFRGFEKLDISLHPSMTLLIGENGAGKTALLEALAVALGGLFQNLPGETKRPIRRQDVRHKVYEHAGMLDIQPQEPARVVATGIVADSPVEWGRALERRNGSTVRYRSTSLRLATKKLANAVESGLPTDLPIIVYYGTQRLWLHKEITDAKRGIGSRYEGYLDALNPASNHRLLAEWMYQQTLVELQTGKPVLQLRAVERAVCQCVEGTSRFYFDVRSQELLLEQTDGTKTPFSFLSDGYRNLLALVADIAWRAAVLNPHYGSDAAAQSAGVVLIDEIELHLHPRWQRRVIGDLRRTFPAIQFVATTHSPQVIAGARRDEVRILENNRLVSLQPFVEGRDSNSLLEDVFGVPERPEPQQRAIDELSRVLDDEKYDQAREMLMQLEMQVGPDDPAVIRARWLLDREAP